MTIITIICIMVTLSALVTTSWYRTGKNNELEHAVVAQRKAENQLNALENQLRESQRHFSITHDNCTELQCDVNNKRSTILRQ
ncbi:hypothetical protein [Yersinia phage fPS-50]|uniref:Ig-like domain-containing protein n=2 Tax=Helsettvirus fPS9 TaxID=2733625 RepID=A0A2D0PDY9_9CAUD|nr:hypothetical protein [Yersinia phage fPS-52]SOO46690.1 hypothetical protein [Yersinia phage fPS-50]